MDSDIVDKVKELVEEASRPPTLTVEGEDRRYFWLKNEDTGEYEPKVKRVDGRTGVLSLASLADFARTTPGGEFWYSRSGVVYRYDEGFLSGTGWNPDRATLALKPSKAIEVLAGWANCPTPLKQDALVRHLRTTFRESFEPATLLDSVSAVTWRVDDQGQSVVAQGSRSVSRNTLARFEGRSGLPDTVTFVVPVWETGGDALTALQFRVGCALEAAPQDQTFTLIPFAGAVERAWTAAEAELERLLRGRIEVAFEKREDEDEAPGWPPVFHGSPGN